MPVAVSDRASRPFEKGRPSSPPSGSGSPMSPVGHRGHRLARDRLVGEPDQLAVEVEHADRDELVVREHDLHPALERRLGDDVDRGRLDLDQVDLGFARTCEVLAESVAAGEVAGDEHDFGAELLAQVPLDCRVGVGRRRREVRDPPAEHRRDRPRPQLDRDDRQLLDLVDRLDQLVVEPAR